MGIDSPLYIGIDLAIAKKKRLPVVACQWREEQCLPLPLRSLDIVPPIGSGNIGALDPVAVCEFANEVSCYLQEISRYYSAPIARIAIDAPRAPALAVQGRRQCEVALDRAGISCIPTPVDVQVVQILAKARMHIESGGAESRIPHANQLWMIYGFELFRQLEEIAPCLEVYPQLTVRLLEAGDTHKSKPGAVEYQRMVAAVHTGWPEDFGPQLGEVGHGARHDQLDAFLAAWVAALPEPRRQAYGVPPHDVIWAPRVEASKFRPTNEEKTAKAKPVSEPISTSLREHMVCPACQTYNFKRWPLGWDAHAAHRCEGVEGDSPEARKADFKARFLVPVKR
ncbi:DUF429 domain-containing protein [Haliea sp. E17]|uniref:DUF429 domain-containing protein n=1 Tax=Haliea sp. E17 TaxID=3401576 RepID=UPI003AAA9E31